MLFRTCLLWLCLHILESIESAHPQEPGVVASPESAAQSSKKVLRDGNPTPDVLCWYGTVPPDPNVCTYVFEALEPRDKSNLFNFYVCNIGGNPHDKLLVMKNLPYNLDNIIDTRLARFSGNISVQIWKNKFDGGLLSFIWHVKGYLPSAAATQVFDGRLIGWNTFPNCLITYGFANAGVLVISNNLGFDD